MSDKRQPFEPQPGKLRKPADVPPLWRRRHRPIAIDRTPVKRRGDVLHDIWWRGKQWAVTAYGLEKLDGTYPIAADRLGEDPDVSWLEHMGTKSWVDPDDFATAWLVALALHGAGLEAGAVRSAVREQLVPPTWDEVNAR